MKPIPSWRSQLRDHTTPIDAWIRMEATTLPVNFHWSEKVTPYTISPLICTNLETQCDEDRKSADSRITLIP